MADGPAPSPLFAHRARWQALLLALLPFTLLIGCFDAPFLNYDDPAHIERHALFNAHSLGELFTVVPDTTYFPVTLISYQIDKFLFRSLLTDWLGTWAPGVRFMTCLYHTLAAFILWRLLLRLGCGAAQSFLIALIFAIHPTVAETVCWPSERKNALVSLFGFLALYCSVRFEAPAPRVVLSAFCLLLAALSKPSAPGLMPLIPLLVLFGGKDGLRTASASSWRDPRAWTRAAIVALPLALVVAFCMKMNLRGHAGVVVGYPGGSFFTTLLTDFEIVARYLYNLAVPAALSFCYYVDPIATPLSPRLLMYAALVCGTVGSSIALARNWKLCLFGWLWFFCALAPNANLFPTSYLMQDRYIYISLPGFLLAMSELLAGVNARWMQLSPRALAVLCVAYLALLLALGQARSVLFSKDLLLFDDAVRKSPLSGHAHEGFASACDQAAAAIELIPGHDPKMVESLRNQAAMHMEYFLTEAPDRFDQASFLRHACDHVQRHYRRGETAAGDKLFQDIETYVSTPSALHPAAGYALNRALVEALGAMRQMLAGERDAALKRSQFALELSPDDATVVLMRAQILLMAGTQLQEKTGPENTAEGKKLIAEGVKLMRRLPTPQLKATAEMWLTALDSKKPLPSPWQLPTHSPQVGPGTPAHD
jgi:hypothetical protein